MTFSRWTGSAWNALTTFKRWDGSAWQLIAKASRWSGSAWVQFGFSQIVTVSPATLSASSNVSGNITTSAGAVNVTGGSGSFTYQWLLTQTGDQIVVANTPTASSTVFHAHFTAGGGPDFASATVTCQVTDTSTGIVVTSNNSISVTINYTGP